MEYTANRLKPFAHAKVAQGSVPNQWPDGRFELIVLGELLYYLQETEIERLAQRCRATLLASGSAVTVVSCNWLHPLDSFPLGGTRVHENMHQHLQVPRAAQWRDADFCLDIWSSARQSVAQREGRRE